MNYIQNPILANIIHEELKNLQPGINLERLLKILKEIRKETSRSFYPEDFIHIFQDTKSPRDTSYRNLVMLRAMKILRRIEEKKVNYQITNLGKYVLKSDDETLVDHLKNIFQYLFSIRILLDFIKDNHEVSKEDICDVLGKEMIYYNKITLGKATSKPYNRVICGVLLVLLVELKILQMNVNTKKFYY